MRIKVIIILLVLVVFSAILAGNAMALQNNGAVGCGNVSFTVTPNSGPAGSSASVSGYGAMAMDSYTLYWDANGGTMLASGSTDGSGGFSTMITIPADATLGTHNVIYVGFDPQEQPVECPQPFTVIAATADEGVQPDAYTTRSALPSTGITALAPVAGFLLSGAAVMAWRRRS